uniref:Transcription factor CBF/NF-Y/archaeal histone domain-containing protein n=1 Tax=Plectus sambesii TaxID=2011161 RepID=A0A914W0D7_9BILA
MGDDEVNGQTVYSSQLPISKIKKIAKLHPDTRLLSSEATQTIAIACEKFIGLMAEQAYNQAQSEKRKTVQMRDIDYCIRNTVWLEFLDGALDGWPEFSSKSKTTTAASAGDGDGEDQAVDGKDDALDASEGEEEPADEDPINEEPINQEPIDEDPINEELLDEDPINVADDASDNPLHNAQGNSRESIAQTQSPSEHLQQSASSPLHLSESQSSFMDVS